MYPATKSDGVTPADEDKSTRSKKEYTPPRFSAGAAVLFLTAAAFTCILIIAPGETWTVTGPATSCLKSDESCVASNTNAYAAGSHGVANVATDLKSAIDACTDTGASSDGGSKILEVRSLLLGDDRRPI